MKKSNIAITIIVIILIGILGYFIFRNPVNKNPSNSATETGNANTSTSTNTAQNTSTSSMLATTTQSKPANNSQTVIGKSVEGRDIVAYHYGAGDTEILFVGGIHGGYEWNTALLAYELSDHLASDSSVIPKGVRVTVIPVLNPDGLYKVTGKAGRFAPSDVSKSDIVVVSGRFNSDNVDLNRNFDCDWQSTGVWQNKNVSGGDSAFSEPESIAMKNYIDTDKPAAVVVWYSAAGGVYSSSCHTGILPETTTLTGIYSKASGYPAHNDFDFYQTTGDMVNWLAKNNVPAISVLLTDHQNIEWAKNWAGTKALLGNYAK